MPEKYPARINGFYPPFDQLQTVAVFGFTLYASFFIFLEGVLLRPTLLNALFYSLVLAWAPVCIATYVIATFSVPHDPRVFELVDDVEFNAAGDAILPDGWKYCGTCQTTVLKTTKHCWICNKCIANYDHHCRWLNNCVGGSNYAHFALFLGNAALSLLVHLSLGIYFFLESFFDFGTFCARVQRAYGSVDAKYMWIVQVALGFAVVMQILAMAMIGHLQGLHIWLRAKGLTTYKWILANRQIRDEEKEERISLGMSPGTPTCHSLAVYCHKRKHGVQQQTRHDSSKPPANKYAQSSPSADDGANFEGQFSDVDLGDALET